MLRCIFCGLCVEACPTDAITMTSFFEFTGKSRSSTHLFQEELLEPPRPVNGRSSDTSETRSSSRRTRWSSPGREACTVGGESGERSRGRPLVWLPTERCALLRDERDPVTLFRRLRRTGVSAGVAMLFQRNSVHAALLLG